jgi:hypothetical protein
MFSHKPTKSFFQELSALIAVFAAGYAWMIVV